MCAPVYVCYECVSDACTHVCVVCLQVQTCFVQDEHVNSKASNYFVCTVVLG